MELTHDTITKAIIRSQHCQRNWDLEREIPEDDLKLIENAVTLCPSKQNVAFYNTYFITNRDVIEKIHAQTNGFYRVETNDVVSNSQTLANLLVVFTKRDVTTQFSTTDEHRNTQIDELIKNENSKKALNDLERDSRFAVGIAAGYCNLTSSLLGYSTGCCSCYNPTEVQKILNTSDEILLLMGIGFSDRNFNRRVHHKDHSYVFPTKKKVPIDVTYIK